LAVPEAESVELGEGEFFDWEIIDCRVETIDGVELGTVREVLHTGSAPVLVIRGGNKGEDERGEHLVPLVESICVEIDAKRKLIRVDAPEGLLEF
jgi:16S rRNA processing protein RimM